MKRHVLAILLVVAAVAVTFGATDAGAYTADLGDGTAMTSFGYCVLDCGAAATMMTYPNGDWAAVVVDLDGVPLFWIRDFCAFFLDPCPLVEVSYDGTHWVLF